MRKWMRRLGKVIDFLGTVALLAFGLAVATKYEYAHLVFGACFFLKAISALFHISEAKDALKKLPSYLSDFKVKRKAELPWIAAIALVNAGFFTIGLWYVNEFAGKAERRSTAETLATVSIVTTLALFGLMHWSLKIAQAKKAE